MKLASVLLCCAGLAACTSEPMAPSTPATIQPVQAASAQTACPDKALMPIATQLPQAGFVPAPPSGATVAVPQRLRGGQPDYPSASLRCREEGKVTITYCVGADGRVENVQVVTSSGYARLDNSVLAWADRDRHTPGTVNAQPRRYCGLHFEHEFEIAEQPAEHAVVLPPRDEFAKIDGRSGEVSAHTIMERS